MPNQMNMLPGTEVKSLVDDTPTMVSKSFSWLLTIHDHSERS